MPVRSCSIIGKLMLATTMTLMASASSTDIVLPIHHAVPKTYPPLAFLNPSSLTFSGRKSGLIRTINPLSLDGIFDRQTATSSIDEFRMAMIDDSDGGFEDPAILMEQMNRRPKSLAYTLNVDPPTLQNSNNYHRPQIIGHRGSPYHELENTVAGFQTCADIGCDGIELDVFRLKCGTLVVFHGGGSDETPGCLWDYCGIQGTILDYTADEARRLTFNPYFEEFGCPTERLLSDDAFIPTLKEVLDQMKNNEMTIKLELKGPETVTPVLQLVERLDMVDRCRFSSFDHDKLHHLRELRPDVNADGTFRYQTGALFSADVPDDFVNVASRAGASEVHLRYDTCTTERIRAIHDAGMDSMAWFRGPVGMRDDVRDKYHDVGNEDERMYQVLINTGVRSLCVNKPDVLVDMLRGKHTRSVQRDGIDYYVAENVVRGFSS